MTRTSRSFDFRVESASTQDDGLTLTGYAAVFDTPAEINDRLGSYTETISRGSFTKTLSENPNPILQFDHGTHPMIGSIPLGSIRKLREDEAGLYVEARLSDNWLVEPVRDAIRDGGINGMSFQFEVLRDEWSKDQSERTIREIKLYEVGPVVWPAYADTSVGVRSEISNLLSCGDIRTDLARTLTFGESDAASSTSDTPDDTPPRAPVVPDRQLAAPLLKLAKLTAMPSDYLKDMKT